MRNEQYITDEQQLIYALIVIAGFIVVILPIILFFKIWGMTNNVWKILKIIEAKVDHDAKVGGYFIDPYEEGEGDLKDERVEEKAKSEFWRLDKVPFKREEKGKDI